MAGKPWTPERYQHAIKVLGKHTTVVAAAKELGVGYRQLAAVFRQREQSASDFLGEIPKAPEDLGAAHVEKKKESFARADRARLLEALAEAQARAKFMADVRDGKLPPVVRRKEFGSGGKREGMAVALLSDAHIEEVVRPTAVGGRNSYDLEISAVRMQRFFDAFRWQIDFHRERFEIREVLLWLGGDLFTGHIHDELIETNDCHPTDAILTLRARLKWGIGELLKDRKLERLIIPCNVGNHGRTTSKRRVKTVTENSYEWLLYNVLAGDFEKDSRVEFEIPRSAHTYVEAYDMRLHFHHGDEVRYWGGVGGLSVPLGKRVPMWDTVIESDLHHVGHFHQFRDFGHTIVNGSVIGYSEYAMAIGAEYEPPQQGFYVLDAKRGKTCVSPLWVGEEPEA